MRGETQLAESGPQKRALPGSKYSDQEIERGLVALALFSGNRRRASEALQRQGLDVPDTTLRAWRDQLYEGWYAEVQAKVMPRVRELAAEKHTELADLEGEAARKLLSRLTAEYKDIPVRDLPGSIRNLDVGARLLLQQQQRDFGGSGERDARQLAGQAPDGQHIPLGERPL